MPSTSASTEQIPVRVFGGPTALFEYGGLRFLTDPTFDAPGDYQVPGGRLTKTAPSSAEPADLGRVDVVLLSHDEHPDNLGNGVIARHRAALPGRSVGSAPAGALCSSCAGHPGALRLRCSQARYFATRSWRPCWTMS